MKIIQSIIFACVFMIQGCGEEKSKLSKVSTLKSQQNNIIQETQTKEETFRVFAKLNWETDMDHAFERAKKEHKNVMIMVEDIRCKWCTKMKKEALSDQSVQDKLQSYILLKVQRSDTKTAKRIVDFTGAVPSFYFMQADKEVVETVVGYFLTEDFLGYLNEIEENN